MMAALTIGFLLGMRHALEADHIAAVASLTSQNRSLRSAVRQGVVWGAGHTFMLFLFGGMTIMLNTAVPEALALWLEFLVGIMLVLLGADVLRRLIRDRIHYHVHSHGPRTRHFHAHSHRGEPHGRRHPEQHAHSHSPGFPVRALFVGFMHGMAGSAVLIVMTLQSLQSPLAGLIYIALFGTGSIIGMAVLSIIIAMPLQKARSVTWFHNGLQALIGGATIGLGVLTMANTYWGISF